MRGLGATPDLFNQQLSIYRDQLIPLYRQKTQLTAQRESLRFMYSTGVKSKFSSVVSSILGDIFAKNNPDLNEMFNYLVNQYQKAIPMVTMNGAPVTGWAYPAGFVDTIAMVSLLGPTAGWFQYVPEYYGYEVPTTFYEAYGEAYKGYPVSHWIEQSFFPYWVKVEDYSIGVAFKLEAPPNKGYLLTLEKSGKVHNVNGNYGELVSLMNKTYNGISLVGVIADARNLYTQILTDTFKIFQAQDQISTAENDLVSFINEYSQYSGDPIEAQQILLEIRAAAEQAEEPVVESDIEEPEEIVEEVVVEEPKKSKLPLVAAAAGILYLIS